MLIASKFFTHTKETKNQNHHTITNENYSQVFADEGILAKGFSQIDKGSYQRCEACNTMIFWGELKQRNPYRSYIRIVIKPCNYSVKPAMKPARQALISATCGTN
jgi:hypothetical protein